MTCIYRCSPSTRSKSAGSGGAGGSSGTGGGGGRARGHSWGKNPSWAILTRPARNTRSVLGTSILAKYIRTSVLLNMHISSTASTAQHSTAQTAQSPLNKAANQACADQSTYQKKSQMYARSTCMRRCFPGAWSSWHLQRSPVCT